MILMFAVNFIIFLLLTTLILIESNCSNEQCENELLPLKHLISQYFQDPEIVTPVNDIYLLTINLPIIDQVDLSDFHHHLNLILLLGIGLLFNP